MKRFYFMFCILIFFVGFRPALVYSQREGKQVIESLEFREVDIKDVLRQLSKQYGLNIVFSEKVSGLITVQLADVSLDEAIDSIITVNGFVYNKRGSVIKVTTPEEAEREGKVTRLFKLNNADAMKLKDTLTKVLTSEGSIEGDSRSNAIIVTDSISVINKIEGMIPTLDEITPQVLIEAKLVETSLTNTDKLGIDWTTTISAAASKRPITFPFKAWGQNTEYYPEQKATDITYSTSSGQFTAITSDFASKFGEIYTNPNLGPTLSAFPMAASSYFTFGTLDFSTLKTVFDFLKERKNTKLVANPRILTLNNQKATMNVGKVLSVPTYERNETTGNMEITGWEKYNVGVSLEVTPQISPDGHIKMKIKPEVSSLVGYASTRNGVNEGPITTTRTAETEVQIMDGQTVVIGGMVKDESLTTVKKIPILGDIPILKLLFTRKEIGSSSNPTEKTDLLIFVTAHIIKDTAAQSALAEEEKARAFKLTPRGIK